MQLNDKEIRKVLIARLKTQTKQPKVIIEELRVHNGKAIADVVAVHTEAHCYEIKGDGDNIERILVQEKFYNPSFRKITLVTTGKHLKKALATASVFWGIMVAEYKNGTIQLKYVRRALQNPYFDKKIALLALWKDEMLELLGKDDEKTKTARQSRIAIAAMLSNKKRKVELSQHIALTLLNRAKINKYNQSSYR